MKTSAFGPEALWSSQYAARTVWTVVNIHSLNGAVICHLPQHHFGATEYGLEMFAAVFRTLPLHRLALLVTERAGDTLPLAGTSMVERDEDHRC